MDKSGTTPTRKVSRIVFRVAAVLTVVFAFLVRLMGFGWLLIIYGPALLFLAVLHLIIQFAASAQRARTGWPSGVWLVVSDVLFFLGFGVQADGGDVGGCYVGLVNLLATLRGIRALGGTIEFESFTACEKWNNFALVLLGSLVTTWVIMIVLMVLHPPKVQVPGAAPAA